MNILLVDDDVVFRERLGRSLGNRGYDVFHASNLQETIDRLKLTQIERAVVDLKLKKEWGLAVLKAIIDAGCKQALVLSGYGSISSATQAIKLGAINFLSKPVTVDQLLDGFSGYVAQEENKLPTLDEYEWEYILRVLNENQGNITKTAKVLGVHRQALQRKFRERHF